MAYNLGPVKPHVAAAAEEVGKLFNVSNIGGWRATGSVPNSDHPKGLALDFMTFSKDKGDEIAAYLVANAGRLGITYVIWWRRIWQNGGWKDYDGPSPHIDHVHASFTANAGSGGPAIDPVAYPGEGTAKAINEGLERLRDPAFWKRVGTYALGGAAVFIGVQMLVGRPAAEIAGSVANVIPVGKVAKGVKK